VQEDDFIIRKTDDLRPDKPKTPEPPPVIDDDEIQILPTPQEVRA